MQQRRRIVPRRFSWVIQRADQLLPHWVNVEGLDWDAAVRSLEVEVVDTPQEPNTVRVTATGIGSISLFLDDETVRLDEPVRVTLNGRVVFGGTLVPLAEPMRTLGRDLDLLFDTEPTRIRRSMFFGWLKSARIVDLRVR
jgi:hypothetical protein